MNEKNRKFLDEALKSLPEHVPDEKAWDQIMTALDFGGKLHESITNLPVHEPDAGSWDKIEPALANAGKKRSARIIPLWIRYSAATAACILLIVFFRQGMLKNGVMETTSYSEEVIVKQEIIPGDTAAMIEAREFIRVQCNSQPSACAAPAVVQLRAQLGELQQAEQELQKVIDTYGSDEHLVLSRIRIENRRGEITRELIRILAT